MQLNTIIYNTNKQEKWVTITPLKTLKEGKYHGCICITKNTLDIHFFKNNLQVKQQTIEMLLETKINDLDTKFFEFRKINLKEYDTLQHMIKTAKLKFNKKTNKLIYVENK